MLSRGGSKLRSLVAQDSDGDSHLLDADTAHAMLRFVLWLLRGEADPQEAIPVRVYYKFDSGAWRSRSTRQLHKVYRCR